MGFAKVATLIQWPRFRNLDEFSEQKFPITNMQRKTVVMRTCGKMVLFSGVMAVVVFLSPILFPSSYVAADTGGAQASSNTKAGDTEPLVKQITIPPGPVDEYNRGTPQSSVLGFIDAARDGKFDIAANYLDLRRIPANQRQHQGQELARQLKVILDRTLVIDPEMLSNDPKGQTEDGLRSSQEMLDRLKTPTKTVDLILQRVPRADGVRIWKFSHLTVANIPHLSEHYGYRPFERAISRYFPDVVFLGWQLWQYAVLIIGACLAYLVAYVLSQILQLFIRHRSKEMGRHIEALGLMPVRILLWFFLVDRVIAYIGPSVTIRTILRPDTLGIIAVTWAASHFVEMWFFWWSSRLEKRGQASTVPLLRPAKTFIRITIVVLALLVWLDNLGFNVGALLAGLGVGGIAIALAAQDTIKNFLGSIMILLDKPYRVGERIVVKGHDGVVEDIGLRSTKLRLLTGHQTTLPNELMAASDIENIGRRPHIRRLFSIAIRYDTPLEKVEKATKLIEDLLTDHEGIDPDFPPKVYFSEFNRDSLNIMVIYWYHPADYWGYMDFSQRINKQIKREFEKEGIEFALPSRTIFTDKHIAKE